MPANRQDVRNADLGKAIFLENVPESVQDPGNLMSMEMLQTV
jgi:hypothetical protein